MIDQSRYLVREAAGAAATLGPGASEVDERVRVGGHLATTVQHDRKHHPLTLEINGSKGSITVRFCPTRTSYRYRAPDPNPGGVPPGFRTVLGLRGRPPLLGVVVAARPRHWLGAQLRFTSCTTC